jgi:hypothetical protein
MGKVQVGVIYELKSSKGQSFFAANTLLCGQKPAVPSREYFEVIPISDLLQVLEWDLQCRFRDFWNSTADNGYPYISLSAPEHRDNGDVFHHVFIGSWRAGFTVKNANISACYPYKYYANIWLGFHKILDGGMPSANDSSTFVNTLNQTLWGSFKNFFEVHPAWGTREQAVAILSGGTVKNEDEVEGKIEDEVEDEVEEYEDDDNEDNEDIEDNTALIENILSESDLEWEDYHLVEHAKYLRRAEPTQEFWDFWHTYKKELKAAKVFVTKEAGVWYVYDWQAAREAEREYEKSKPVITSPRVVVRATSKAIEEAVPEVIEEAVPEVIEEIEPEVTEEKIEEVEEVEGATETAYSRLLTLWGCPPTNPTNPMAAALHIAGMPFEAYDAKYDQLLDLYKDCLLGDEDSQAEANAILSLCLCIQEYREILTSVRVQKTDDLTQEVLTK